jgi:hypothetical protein
MSATATDCVYACSGQAAIACVTPTSETGGGGRKTPAGSEVTLINSLTLFSTKRFLPTI